MAAAKLESASDSGARMIAALPRTIAFLALAALVAGCAELLPKSRAETEAAWHSFEEARAAIERIEPYKTTRADLRARGIGVERDPTITLLSHVDIAVRFPIGGVLRSEDVDPGIRDCLRAGQACNAYQINVRRTNRNRVGNFWLDALRFRRETDVTGWTFNALVLFVDDLAVYAVFGGQPAIHEVEVERNPLGPLQGWGDWASSKALGN
ncbi:MAG: hypothetical protein ACM3O5_10640 [Betaproteobacteria bacterium]